jgi:hypothetical protein
LAHYEAYFTHLENRKYAKDAYNIEVKNPKLILIIGNYENFTREEVDEALRPYQNDKFMIIDYDTLYARFRASAGVHIQESRKLGLNLEIR